MRLSLLFFITVHLSQMVIGHVSLNQIVTGGQHVVGPRLPIREVARVDVVALALGEAVKEHGATAAWPICDQHSKPAAPALAGTRHTLLDEAVSEIGVDLAPARTLDGLARTVVADALASGKPREPSGHENPHASPTR